MLASLKALFKRDVTGTKPGIATSEFWLSLITGAVTLLVGYGAIPSGVAAKYQHDEALAATVISGVIAAGYAIARGITKKGVGGSVTGLLAQLMNSGAYESREPKAVALVNALLDSAGVTVDTLEAKIPASGLTPLPAKGVSELETKVTGLFNDVHSHLAAIEAKLAPKTGVAGSVDAAPTPAPEPVQPPDPPAPDPTMGFPAGVTDNPVNPVVPATVTTSTAIPGTVPTVAPPAPAQSVAPGNAVVTQ